jgi:pSer/pThr/pTyr-binding forkhead associated (FHA) protein
MKCTRCGADLAPGARYCGECWAVVSPQPSEVTPPATDAGPARESSPARAGRLVVEIGPDEGKEFPLRGTMRIGRSEDSEITLADAQASRHHAAISPEPSGFTIQDLDSSNGTFVNGRRLDEPRLLKDGDRLRVANTVLVFRWESAPSAPSPATPRVTPPAVDYEMLPTTEVAWQTPPAGIQEVPAPQAAEPRKSVYAGRIMLGAGLAIVFLAIAAVTLYFLLGNPDGNKSSNNAGEKPPAAITQVVTSAPIPVVTKIVTSEPVATATATPTIAPTTAAPTPTTAPTTAPTVAATATPSGPAFGPITFARDKTDANEPIDPTTTFPADTVRVYALFDYEGMSADLEWGRTWYRDGEEYVSKTENWSGKESGTWSLWLFRTSGDPLVPATYELRIYIQGEQVQSATFVVTE